METKELTTEQLEQMLAERKKKEREEREKKRKEYEERRDSKIQLMVMQAVEFQNSLKQWKAELHQAFEKQMEELVEYGALRSNSKGGFSLVHSSGEFKAVRTRSTQPSWDERSTKAIELISDFLKDTVKKRDQKIYEVLISFIQKNEKGELEYSKVMHLFKHRDKFDDPRWVEGLNLINESYSVHLRAYGYEFYKKSTDGKWDKIEINFTAIDHGITE